MAKVKGIVFIVMTLLFFQLMLPHLGTMAVSTGKDESNIQEFQEAEEKDKKTSATKQDNKSSTDDSSIVNESKNDKKVEQLKEKTDHPKKETEEKDEKSNPESNNSSNQSKDTRKKSTDKNKEKTHEKSAEQEVDQIKDKPVEKTIESTDQKERNDNKEDEEEQEQEERLLNNGVVGEYVTGADSIVASVIMNQKSTNNHTRLHKLWAKANTVYVAVNSTHSLQFMTLNGINSTDSDVYSALINIRVNGVEYNPTDGLKGNTKDAHWTVFKFNLTDLNITNGETAFFIKGIGGGHDVNGHFTHDSPKTNITVNKQWVGGANHPEVTLLLFSQIGSGSKQLIQTGVVNGTENPEWTYTWTQVPQYDSFGRKYTFTVDEENVPLNYEKSVDGLTVTNTFIKDNITINVNKKWIGPTTDSATFELYANNIKTDKTLVLTSPNWSGQFKNLDKFDDSNKKIAYSVHEVPIPGYSTAMTGSVENGFTFTNTSINSSTETIDYDVEKKWIGPDAGPVTISLLANGKDTNQTIVLNEQNGWFGTFSHLDKYDSFTGDEINYSVKEIDIPAGYSVDYREKNGKFTITNSATSHSLTVIKVGENNERLPDATFELHQTSTGLIIDTQTTDHDGVITFANLELGDYQLIEKKAPNGYKKINKEIPITIDSEYQNITKKVQNTRAKWILPDTGGSGPTTYYAIGILLMAMMLLISFKRKA